MSANYENAARIYCKKVGLNPDEMLPAPHPAGLAVPFFIPQWMPVAEDMFDLGLRMSAMKEAAEQAVAKTQINGAG